MIVGLFTSVLGKRSAEENKGGATSDGGHVAVLDPPAASAAPAAQPALVAQQTPTKAAPGATTATPQGDGSKPEPKACPQCGSTEPWGISSWCPNCFYHPRMGSVVITTPVPDPEVRHLAPGHSHQPASYAAMFQSIPLWAHPLWIGVISIFLLSVYMGIKLPKFGYERALWTLVQAGLGLTAAATAHVLVFFKTIPNTDKYGPFDLFDETARLLALCCPQVAIGRLAIVDVCLGPDRGRFGPCADRGHQLLGDIRDQVDEEKDHLVPDVADRSCRTPSAFGLRGWRGRRPLLTFGSTCAARVEAT